MSVEILTTVLLAVGGWWFSLWREREKRKIDASIDHVNSQIEKLWGPLYAGAKANDNAWASLRKRWVNQFETEIESEGDGYLQGIERRRIWVTYNKSVFQPINQGMISAIMNNTHLFEADGNFSIPDEIEKFIGHVESWRGVVSRWDDHDFNLEEAEWYELEATDAFNIKILDFAKINYEKCIQEKKRLIGEKDNWRFIQV